MKQGIEDRIREAAAKEPTRPYLVILPASGNVRKIIGKFIFVEIGGDTKWSPMIFNGQAAIAFDPRCIIVQAGDPAKVVYHPREVMDKIHPSAVKWLNENPGVFVLDVNSGLTEIGTSPDRKPAEHFPLFDPTIKGSAGDLLLRKAAKTNSERDEMDGSDPWTMPLDDLLRTAICAINCGLGVNNKDAVAEGIVMVQQAEARCRAMPNSSTGGKKGQIS